MARISEVSTRRTPPETGTVSSADDLSEYFDSSRVGTLLIILNHDYTGGEISVAYREREMLFEPAVEKTRSFYIAR